MLKITNYGILSNSKVVKNMKKKKGFTLIELLASLVILAFILVIAVPRIVNVIDNSKLGTITSSAKVVLDSAEKKQSENQVLENPSIINCENVSKLNDTDYSSCDLTFNNKIPYIVLVGSGKLEGYKCEGTKDNLNCRKVVNISLTIDLDGGTGNNQAGNYERNTTLELISPSKEGYDFSGWEIVNGDGSINNNILTLGIKNMKIKALYQLNEQKLNIDLDGGTGNNQAGSYKVGTSITLDIPTKEGYDFSGWELISGNSILSGNTITIGSEETTIKAIYTAKKYTVTYNANGGTVSGTSKSVTYNAKYGTLPTPKRAGYSFLGWYTAKTGGSKITETTIVKITSNQTIYAQWKETLITYEDLSKNYKCKNSSAGATPYIEYGGNCTLLNDGSGNWRIKFTTSGTVKFNTGMSIDIFLVGGGGGGSDNGGGGGGYTKTYKSQVISTGSYAVNVGSGGGAGSNGGASYFKDSTTYVAQGGNSGSGSYGGSGGSGGGGVCGAGGSYGNSGNCNNYCYGDFKAGAAGTGQKTTTCEFGEGTTSSCTKGTDYAYSGGGTSGYDSFNPSAGGGASCNGGSCGSAKANTGGGGGGYYNAATSGGSGIVIIRNKR